MPDGPRMRSAVVEDASAIAAIWTQGIEERQATFETRPKSVDEVGSMIRHAALVLVAEQEGHLVAFAKVGPYDDPAHYYAGVGEATMYVERRARGGGVGRALLNALADVATRRGYWKLVGKIFTSNTSSIALVHACGWREVGVHHRHGQLDGEWKDVLVVELPLGAAAG